MIKQFYRLNAIATICIMLASLALQATPTDDHASSTPSKHSPSEVAPSRYLIPPEFYPYGYPGEQDFIRLEVESDNPGANTEIWHSLSENSGYTLVATLGPDEYEFYHYNLKPRTVHYYKARAVEGSEVSAFSEVYWQQTLSKNYAPDFTATVLNESTVELTLTDRSYNSDYYEIYANGEYIDYIVFNTDSGSTKKIYFENAAPGTTYNFSVTLIPHYDQFEEDNIATASVTMPSPSCSTVGSVEREVWTEITGGKVASIPTYLPPNSISTITSLQGPTNSGNNYGARIRGYLCPPQTGNYTFYISSDDQSELWVSTNADPATKRLVASVSGYTSVGQWDKYPTQKSAAIALTSGTSYYFEVLHKESGSGDHLAVGWQLPNGVMERPIGGNRLIKYGRANYQPFIEITSPAEAASLNAPATFTVTTKAYDPDSEIAGVEFRMRDKNTGNNIYLTDNTAPYSVEFTNVPAGEYILYATAFTTDGQSNVHAISVDVKESGCAGKGSITREIWTGIPGTSISSVNFNNPPSTRQTLTSFETGQYYANDYGSRIQGYICVPQTGPYTFWISSDDNSELWLSTNDDQNNKRKIAWVPGATKFREYTKYASQKSVVIDLIAGRKYYIEARHKEGTGNDFVSVGWQLPNGTVQLPIAGTHLIPYVPRTDNQYPTVTLTSPTAYSSYTAGSDIVLRANPSDADGYIYKVAFRANGQLLGEDYEAPYEMTWTDVPAGTHQVWATAYDNDGALGSSPSTTVYVTAPTTCNGTGTIYWEKWTGITGTSLSSVPFDTPPNSVTTLTQFGTPNYTGNEYGSRIRAYLCVPLSGAYQFALASDDASELWLSTDENPANKVRIAYVTTALKGWSNLSPHRSGPVNLVAGRRYYIEVRHKEGNGADFVQVGWDMPNGAWEGPIPGNRLSPYEDLSTSANAIAVDEIESGVSEEDGVSLYPNPISQGGELRIVLSDMDDTAPTVEIMSATGVVMQSKQVTASQNELTMHLDRPYTQGMYLVKIIGARRQWVKKLQIK